MSYSLSDKVLVVTGGSSGIGLASVKLALECGAKVALCGRDAVKLNAAIQHDNALTFVCDVTKENEVKAFAVAVQSRFGQIDALVTNAGQGRVSTFATTSDEAWHEELTLKFFSQIYPIRAFQPLMKQGSSIVAVNSLLAYQPEPHMVATSAARSGVQNLIKSLATEFSPNIRVNSILLGLVDSNQWQKRFEARDDKSQSRDAWFAELAAKKAIPLGRLGKPEEAAQAILFLASSLSSYITGAALEVSGGVSRFA